MKVPDKKKNGVRQEEEKAPAPAPEPKDQLLLPESWEEGLGDGIFPL